MTTATVPLPNTLDAWPLGARRDSRPVRRRDIGRGRDTSSLAARRSSRGRRRRPVRAAVQLRRRVRLRAARYRRAARQVMGHLARPRRSRSRRWGLRRRSAFTCSRAGAFELRTVVAMTLRSGFWVTQALLLPRVLDRRMP
jgi:hypothetical protein